jgi:hypothetical protein
MRKKIKAKKTKLNNRQIKNGVFVNKLQRIEEIPLRKLRSVERLKEALNRVQFGRKAMIVTWNGAQIAIVLPLYDSEK